MKTFKVALCLTVLIVGLNYIYAQGVPAPPSNPPVPSQMPGVGPNPGTTIPSNNIDPGSTVPPVPGTTVPVTPGYTPGVIGTTGGTGPVGIPEFTGPSPAGNRPSGTPTPMPGMTGPS